MTRLHLSWLHFRLVRKRDRADDLRRRRDPGNESGYWALVDATLRGTGATDG